MAGGPHRIHVWSHKWLIFRVNVGKYADFMDPMGKLVLMASLNSQHHIEQKNFAKHPQPKFIPLLLHHACTESLWSAFFEPDFLQHLQLEHGTRKNTITLIRRTIFLHDSHRNHKLKKMHPCFEHYTKNKDSTASRICIMPKGGGQTTQTKDQRHQQRANKHLTKGPGVLPFLWDLAIWAWNTRKKTDGWMDELGATRVGFMRNIFSFLGKSHRKQM